MKTVETREEIMDKIIFALPKADIIGHLCEKRLTVCA